VSKVGSVAAIAMTVCRLSSSPLLVLVAKTSAHIQHHRIFITRKTSIQTSAKYATLEKDTRLDYYPSSLHNNNQET
jgi:hypothetical protein